MDPGRGSGEQTKPKRIKREKRRLERGRCLRERDERARKCHRERRRKSLYEGERVEDKKLCLGRDSQSTSSVGCHGDSVTIKAFG